MMFSAFCVASAERHAAAGWLEVHKDEEYPTWQTTKSIQRGRQRVSNVADKEYLTWQTKSIQRGRQRVSNVADKEYLTWQTKSI